MCVKTEKLNLDFQGFSKNNHFFDIIINEGEFLDRTMLEKNPEFKQPIPYIVFIKEKKAFCYKRSGKGGEKRLYDKYSIGFGGHVEVFDKDKNNKETIMNALKRETEEEILKIPKIFHPELLGFINDDSTPVGRVHIGLLYVVELEEDIEPHPDEAGNGMFMNFQELDMIRDKMETWSAIALDAVKEKLK